MDYMLNIWDSFELTPTQGYNNSNQSCTFKLIVMGKF